MPKTARASSAAAGNEESTPEPKTADVEPTLPEVMVVAPNAAAAKGKGKKRKLPAEQTAKYDFGAAAAPISTDAAAQPPPGKKSKSDRESKGWHPYLEQPGGGRSGGGPKPARSSGKSKAGGKSMTFGSK
ncbi:hypothetical protein AMAG_03857 [Allomyces macrogynus ATCC 38327]|uniref:Uncharacterized protein n=1 Tax=Allomyces macrogynus (strain ATCC 38327) TaxID=578462 RepID=A0A0L0SB22_ALLM3|nr:hypothetical protein AMAG_03857 [Allomyces macrogynus ATCC 38327]|eukprot:KNE59599.1 hypothetical protein AMAG_03857 [Allomyces macrogynus ATCC 38327]